MCKKHVVKFTCCQSKLLTRSCYIIYSKYKRTECIFFFSLFLFLFRSIISLYSPAVAIVTRLYHAFAAGTMQYDVVKPITRSTARKLIKRHVHHVR